MEQVEKVLEFLLVILLVVVGLLGVFVSVLDLIGIDFENGPWKWLKGPVPITLLTVALLSIALGLERFVRFWQINRRLEKIEHLVTEGPERIIRSLDGIDVQSFTGPQALYSYVVKRMQEAKKTI